MDPRYTTTLGTGPHPTSPRPSSFEMGVGRQDAKKRGKGDGAPSSLSSSSPPDYAYAAAPLSSPIITSKRETATSHLPPRPPSPLTTFTVMCITEASSSSHLCRDFSRSGGERKRAKRGIAGLGLRAGLDGARTRSGVSQYATGGMHLHEGEAVVGVEVEVGDEERQTEASTYLPAYGIHVQAVNPFTVRGRERMRALRPPSHVVHAIIADGASPSLCSSLPMWRRKSSKIADDAIIVGCFTHALPVPPQLPLYSISGESGEHYAFTLLVLAVWRDEEGVYLAMSKPVLEHCLSTHAPSLSSSSGGERERCDIGRTDSVEERVQKEVYADMVNGRAGVEMKKVFQSDTAHPLFQLFTVVGTLPKEQADVDRNMHTTYNGSVSASIRRVRSAGESDILMHPCLTQRVYTSVNLLLQSRSSLLLLYFSHLSRLDADEVEAEKERHTSPSRGSVGGGGQGGRGRGGGEEIGNMEDSMQSWLSKMRDRLVQQIRSLHLDIMYFPLVPAEG